MVAKYMVPEVDAYDLPDQGRALYAHQIFDGLNLKYCDHQPDWIASTELSCLESHIPGKACHTCPYPLACQQCNTEIEPSREILPDGRKSLCITTWKHLRQLDKHDDKSWKTLFGFDSRNYSSSTARKARLRQRVRAVVGGIPMEFEERSIIYIANPDGTIVKKVRTEDKDEGQGKAGEDDDGWEDATEH